MEYSTEEKLEWIIYFIYEFGKKYDLTMKQAFGYLQRFKAIDFIDKHYGYAHTQSFRTMVDELSQYCRPAKISGAAFTCLPRWNRPKTFPKHVRFC